MIRRAALVLALLALAGCGARSRRVSVQSVSFPGAGQTIAGYLVEPGTDGRHPAVVLVHGSGGDRSELLGQARLLACAGLVALTLTEPSTVNPPKPVATVHDLLAAAKRGQLTDVAAVRGAADWLAARPDVDARRFGYLGWSAGAKTGTFVAARDRRFRAVALLSAGAAPVSAFVAHAPRWARAEVRRTLGSIDPIAEIERARPGTVLLEDGRRDEIVPRAALLNVVHAAPKRTQVRWYDTGHALSKRAYRDARAWLVARLA
jgi:dienelactone hydrolase